MTTSITVDDELRKKVKRLAAELDTTQGEIIRQAIEEFEVKFRKTETRNEIAVETMQKASEKRKNIPWRKEIKEKLCKPGIDIDELRITNWGNLDEDSS